VPSGLVPRFASLSSRRDNVPSPQGNRSPKKDNVPTNRTNVPTKRTEHSPKRTNVPSKGWNIRPRRRNIIPLGWNIRPIGWNIIPLDWNIPPTVWNVLPVRERLPGKGETSSLFAGAIVPSGRAPPVRTKHREGSPNSPVLARWIAVSSSISLMRWMARARQVSSGRCFQQGRGERGSVSTLAYRRWEMVGRAGAAAILPRGSRLTAWSCDSPLPHFQIMPGPGACGKPGAMPHSSRPRGTREQEDRKCTTDR
jgi:hypothetical protein